MLKNSELIEEFYNSKKEEYPDLTLEQCKEICFTPWSCLKQEMEKGNLTKVRFKYFGVFQVYKGRAEKMLENLKVKFDSNLMEEKQYKGLKQMIEKYLNKFK